MSDAADWTDTPTRWWLPATVALVLTVVVTSVRGLSGDATGAGAVAWTGAFVAGVLLVTSLSARGYGHLRLTATTLYVGRHAYPLVELDPAVLHAQVVLGRPLRAGEQGPDGTPVPRPRPAAGAWSPTFRTRALLVRLRDGSWYAVATSDPMALLHELVRRAG
ncbi:hypothetical protein [Luteimicrobium subarcticum]|uniref:PH (Pleckstrin Homology) domain-containing protein n=1 Tax=Luteimicrobium subarcticum TaxID=620910 RepID=A0A2M8WJ02_9MICO|nr:hypothetical protein [Luteimicrobium subarcticum]PJI90909.1 hypothetical protein CLV34_2165 [Luteimicrobium subarcticum]